MQHQARFMHHHFHTNTKKPNNETPSSTFSVRGIAANIIDNALLNSSDYTGKTKADGTKQFAAYEDVRVTAAKAKALAAAGSS